MSEALTIKPERTGWLHKWYAWMMSKANHPKAIWFLGFISFIESSFFPLPPDPLLVAMTLQNIKKAWWYGFVCTITSVLGGFLGYYIGFALFELVGKSILEMYNLIDAFQNFSATLNEWAFWAISIKGVTPIPYKVVTIASGATHIDLWTFTIASFIARGFRFLYVAAALRYFGHHIRKILDDYLVLVTIIMIAALVLGFYLLKWVF